LVGESDFRGERRGEEDGDEEGIVFRRRDDL
jgi:hypothetical protein